MGITGPTGFIGPNLMSQIEVSVQSISLQDKKWREKLSKIRPTTLIHLVSWAQGRGGMEKIHEINVGCTQTLTEVANQNRTKKYFSKLNPRN